MRRMGPSVWNIRLGSVVKYKSRNLGPSRKKTENHVQGTNMSNQRSG